MAKVSNEIKIEIATGTVKKEGPRKGSTWEGVRITVGDYSTLVFPSPFELRYVKEQLELAESESK